MKDSYFPSMEILLVLTILFLILIPLSFNMAPRKGEQDMPKGEMVCSLKDFGSEKRNVCRIPDDDCVYVYGDTYLFPVDRVFLYKECK